MPKSPGDPTVNDEQDYVEDGVGPLEDTGVFVAEGQPDAPESVSTRTHNRPESLPDDPLKQLRRQAPDHPPVELTDSRLPPYLGLAVALSAAVAIALMLLAVGATLLVGVAGQGDQPGAASTQERAATRRADLPDEIQGVKVRRGLKSTEPEPLPPERTDP